MGNRRGWGLLCLLGLAGLNACGGDSSAKPDAGSSAGMGYSGVAAGSGGAGGTAGTGGTGAVVPARGCPLNAPKRAELASKLEPISGAANVRALRMTAKGLFWSTNKHQIYRLQSDGSGAQVAQTDDLPDLLTSNAKQLAWHGTNNGMLGVWTMPLDGGSPTLVTPANIFVEVLALDETNAYFGGSVSDGLSRAALSGAATATQVADPFGLDALTVGGGFVYYVESLGESVMRIAAGGGTPEPASTEIGMMSQLLVDNSALYATTLLSIYRIELGQPSMRKVLMPLAQPSSNKNSVSRLLDDGDRLVFADQLDNIGWVSKDGMSCGYIVSEGKTSLVAIPQSDIALDEQYLYLTDLPTGSLSRIKRADIGLAH